MIRNVTKQLTNFLRPAAFSTYKVKGSQPFRSSTTDPSEPQGYMKQDAERVFEQFFKENPPKESERSFFDMDYSEKKGENFSFNPYEVLGLKTGASK